MGRNLVIVESPAKAKTINKILGAAFVVKSSMGHVRDLPEKSLGVDVDHEFKPKYVVVKGRRKVVDELKKAVQDAEAVYLAPDPDREGEAIAWHLRAVLEPVAKTKSFRRVQYNEITPTAVRRAFDNPGEVDMRRVDAQQARRILDRLVGYIVSPVLWRRLRRGLSAGRVQSVALRLVCEREEKIQSFVPEAYWVMGAKVRKQVAPLDPFTIRLVRVNGDKADVKSAEQADQIRADLDGRPLGVAKIDTREVTRRPPPPYITSTLQQAGSTWCGYAPKRTMEIAQRLYEGVDMGEGPVGLITYMRTDSFNVSQDAVTACRELIVRDHGQEYCPPQPNVYRSRSSAQEAHEAIRPTDVFRTPESLEGRMPSTDLKLYALIWRRFVASQMSAAKFNQRSVNVEALPPEGRTSLYTFRASVSEVKFPGYMKVSGAELPKPEGKPDGEVEDQAYLPPLSEGEALDCLQWLSERKETKPPPRYSEASLVRALEQNGIGRPSTYAQILSTLHQRDYVQRVERALAPTELGVTVNRLLVSSLEPLFNVKFTASMEQSLDEVEKGSVGWTTMLGDFYRQFQTWMEQVRVPAADRSAVERVLKAMEFVKEWEPEVARGKRTYSDARFVESIRKQLQTEKKAISQRQLDALLRIAARYRDRVPEVEAALTEVGYTETADAARGEPPDEASLRKLDLLKSVDLDASARRFVDSLSARAESGRRLTEAQVRALDRVILVHARAIPDFERVRADLGIQAELRVDDEASAELLGSLAHIEKWDPPVTRGRMVFDDHAFYSSLAQQFERKRFLSDRQKAALKRMIRRHRNVIPQYEALAAKHGLEKKAEGKETRQADAG